MEQPNIKAPKSFPNASVYILECVDGYYYIGSTINDPRYRLNNHKQDCKKFPERFVYSHINNIGWENVGLRIIENFPCDTKGELIAKEDEFINACIHDEFCLNHIRASVSKSERKIQASDYYFRNKDMILERHKKYLEENKDKVDAYHANYRVENAEKRCEYTRQYKLEHPEEVKATQKAYYEANKEEIIKKQTAYVEENRAEVQRRKKEWAEKNKDAIAEKHKIYTEENKSVIQERGKKYYEENKNIIKEKNKAYREANKEKMKEYLKTYNAENRDKLAESHTCECGGKYSWSHQDRHNESKRHKKYVESLAV